MINEYDIPSEQGRMAKLFHHGEGKHQVLLVHGFNSSEKIWLPHDSNGFSVANELVDMGFGCWLLRLSDPVNGDIEQLALNDLFAACKIIHSEAGEKVRTIVAHSMGGVITRLLISRVGRKGLLKELKNVVFLAVPNHGVSMTYFLKQAETMDELVPKIISMLEEKTPITISNRAYFQLLEISPIIKYINDKKHFLHPKICWYNAIASKDVIVPKESASFNEEEIKAGKIKCFDQRIFRATHMYNSLQLLDQFISPVVATHISRSQSRVLKEVLQRTMNILDYVVAPPIYKSKECFKWWAPRLEP